MTTKKKTKPTKSIYSKLTKALWISFVLLVISIPLYFYSVKVDFLNLFGDMPSLRELDNPEDELSSQLYSSDGILIGKYFNPSSNRTPVDFKDLSPAMVKSLMAAEDIRFREHSGIDLRAVTRAVFGVVTGKKLGGGSTLTQQLAKNLFDIRGTEDKDKYKGKLGNIKGLGKLIDKSKEWILSVILESKYTKDEILAMYLNTIPLGHNTMGVKVAAKTYFNTTPDSLTIPQAALLVGLANAPTRFDPLRNPEKAKRKRNRIINQMLKYEYISQVESDSLQASELVLDYNEENHNEGVAPYFRKVAGNFLRKWAKENNQDLYEGGLKIYTTIDSRLQKYAEESVAEHMKPLQAKFDKVWKGRNPWVDEDFREIKGFIEREARRTEHYRLLVKKFGKEDDSVDIMMNHKRPMRLFTWNGEVDSMMSPIDSLKYYKKFLQTGFTAMDPHSGEIRAWVGGIDHRYFKFDHVYQSKRQPGSTFKPFVYATAIEYGYSPCMKVRNVPVTFSLPRQDPPTYTPKNSGKEFEGEEMTIREAMARSINQITAYLMKRIGIDNVVAKAHAMGIQSNLDAVPALCLGVSPVSVHEMVGAYCTFVNEGIWIEPSFITRIEDKNGNILYDPSPATVQALSEENAYIMLHMLKGTTEIKGGTGLGLGYKLIGGNDIGAKTGTTQNASDGWFMAVTKDLVAGAWTGGDNRSIHFRSWADGQGARTALPIVRKFLTKVYEDKNSGYEKSRFKRPSKRLPLELNCDKYQTNSFESDSTNVDGNFKEDDIF